MSAKEEEELTHTLLTLSGGRPVAININMARIYDFLRAQGVESARLEIDSLDLSAFRRLVEATGAKSARELDASTAGHVRLRCLLNAKTDVLIEVQGTEVIGNTEHRSEKNSERSAAAAAAAGGGGSDSKCADGPTELCWAPSTKLCDFFVVQAGTGRLEDDIRIARSRGYGVVVVEETGLFVLLQYSETRKTVEVAYDCRFRGSGAMELLTNVLSVGFEVALVRGDASRGYSVETFAAKRNPALLAQDTKIVAPGLPPSLGTRVTEPTPAEIAAREEMTGYHVHTYEA